MHRRELLKNGAVALTVAATKPLFAWQGANNRVRMAVIGMGGRSGRVFDSLTRYDDVQFTMGCEVAQNKQTGFQSANRPLAQTLNVVGDYRRVLDRNDIDAVLIGTPDFSHARITADALAAGKHVYVEKPIANNVARINMMLDAYNKYPNLVVQVGTQQRSWDHFIEAKKQMALLGSVTHVLIQHGGGYSQNKQDVAEVPPGLDWDAWQVDAPKKPFKQGYTSFRAWWEYGSGLVGDWGAHHIDVANWFMNADAKQPLKTTAVGFYSNPNTDPECVYSQFSIAWQFDNYIMSFANDVFPRPNFADPKAPDIEGWGVYFYGNNGTLQVNRMGWALRPNVGQTRNRVPAEPAPGAPAGAVPGGGRAGGAPGGGRAGGAPGGGRGGGQAVEMNVYVNPRGGVEEDYPLHAHTRDFLDKLKAKDRKTNAPMEVGYNSALPALLALEAMKENKVLGWDPAARKSKAL
jgi:predicted dehydrogenase